MTIDIESVMASLTLEQKVSLLAGHDNWHTVALPGVAAMRMSDGPAGVRGTSWTGPASASFPCGTSLGATFDPDLVEEIGAALGEEARSKGAHVLLAPTVNLHRTPIGGRNFECMSEDPVLTARIAVGYIRGVQRHHVACCVKHFVGNDTEFERHTISSEIDEVTLREAYLVPFERAVQPVAEGGANVRSLMSSYNRINGVYASDHRDLLRGVLRDEWGFDGVVISDWFGTHTAAESLEASLDLEMPGPPRERGEKLLAAVRNGETTQARVDEAVRRLLQLFNWSGVGEVGSEERTADSDATRDVIRRAATAGTVLLKNEGVLPLAPDTRVALLGPNAERGQVQGGGSARVRTTRPSMPLAALQQRGVAVLHEAGCRIDKRLQAMRGEFRVRYTGADGATGDEMTDRLSFIWMDDPAPGVSVAAFGVSVNGSFVPDVTGDWQVSLTVVGSAVLRIDGEIMVDLTVPQTGGAFFGLGNNEIRVSLACEAGVRREVNVEIVVEERSQLRGLLVGAEPPASDNAMDAAVAAAAGADVAIVIIGTNADWETEGEDRTSMDLPGAQDELVRRVAAVNPRTVVVINSGSPVSMPWLADVAAVMQVWFPGEAFGDALVDMLFGVTEPGGRLPLTIPLQLSDTPAYPYHPGRDGKAEYGEGLLIGHRWYDAQEIEPAFAFGFGLGYTTWELGEVAVAGDIESGVTVSVTAHNVGARAGSSVVQCYIEPATAEPGRPVRTLQGFARISAATGETATATIELDQRAFSRWDAAAHSWVVTAGDHRLLLGWSSRDLTSVGVSHAPEAG
ncbi:MAG TPA: glycoside hydrolase family 3 C-terminal domain-containing protein [Ilumatobacteraceae bacterium]|nr:glycoside hydrolase family 3 C-terminal domain-containing protein [Ilumatobacteraceae bacterium]HRB01929.1 glycoside hydrolase family 3 C-terminal domain-containing protein [Ilumatobacteraceae bacterium]